MLLNKHGVRASVAAVGLALLTGCSSTGARTTVGAPGVGPGAGQTRAPADSASKGPAAASSTSTDEPLLDSPLQAYRLTPSETVAVTYARDLLIQQCMAGFGFDYPLRSSYAEALSGSLADERVALGRIFGITDAAIAAQYDYLLPTPDDASGSPYGSQPSESAAFILVLKGRRPAADGSLPRPGSSAGQTRSPGQIDGQQIPAGGCAGEADRTLGTGDPDVSVFGLAHTLWIQDWAKLTASDAYRAVVADWAACLAGEGYHVTDPLNDHADIQAVLGRRRASGDESGEGPASAAEIELALADISCKEQVDLVDRLNRAQAAVNAKTIEQNQLALDEDRKRLDQQVRLATSIVADSVAP